MLACVVRSAFRRFRRTLAAAVLASLVAMLPDVIRAEDRDPYEATPRVQLEHGALPDADLHALVPLASGQERIAVWRNGRDVELGLKYRFVHEGERPSQIATLPLIMFPIGKDRAGHRDKCVFLPSWLQKTVGRWMTYGGGGYWRNPGAGNATMQASWFVQRSLAKTVSVGTELFYQTKRAADADARLAFNVGATVKLADDHHLLGSAGHDIRGDDTFVGYLAYRWIFRWREHAGN
jgi:hypothetical protein